MRSAVLYHYLKIDSDGPELIWHFYGRKMWGNPDFKRQEK